MSDECPTCGHVIDRRDLDEATSGHQDAVMFGRSCGCVNFCISGKRLRLPILQRLRAGLGLRGSKGMRGGKQWLLLVCEVVGVVAALLVLPCAIIDFALGTHLVSFLSPSALFALACAMALTVVSLR